MAILEKKNIKSYVLYYSQKELFKYLAYIQILIYILLSCECV